MFFNYSLLALEAKVTLFPNNGGTNLEISNSYQGVVKLIQVEDGEDVGTGFFIRSDWLSTAAHVSVKGPLYFIDDLTGKPVYTRIIGFDKENDLVILQTINYESEYVYSIGPLNEEENDSHKSVAGELEIASEAEEEDVVIIPGFPHGSFNIVRGFIVSELDWLLASFWVRITHKTDREMSTFYRMSGAPVFSEDILVGVAILGNIPSASEGIGFTPVEMLKNLVRRIEDRSKPSLIEILKKGQVKPLYQMVE